MMSESSQSKSRHRWVVLYWMPYDNNLVRFGEPIIEMLVRGTRKSEAVVVVQSDYWGDISMRRRWLVNGVIHEMAISGEGSSDVSEFSAFLDWANLTFEADHWAIMVVGHGGKLNEISPDAHHSSYQRLTWMGVDEFTNAVSRFNQATNGRVELLFFQNCNKATLEVVYEARNCARYTLASQMELGAPNYYYEGFLEHLQDPSIGGREAAIAIMESERADMYHTLTLVDNQAVKQIPGQLSRLIQPLLSNPLPTVDLSAFSTFYEDERYCDVLALLESLSNHTRQAQDAFIEFADFLQSAVISDYKTGGELYGSDRFRDPKLKQFRGLSLCLPNAQWAIFQYRSLALYQDINLFRLYLEILNSQSSINHKSG